LKASAQKKHRSAKHRNQEHLASLLNRSHQFRMLIRPSRSLAKDGLLPKPCPEISYQPVTNSTPYLDASTRPAWWRASFRALAVLSLARMAWRAWPR
jgi:hypothetical protein